MSGFVTVELKSCVPGCFFGWMVTAEEPQTCQQFAAPNLGNLNHMAALLQTAQHCSLQYSAPALTSNAVLSGEPNPDMHGLNAEQFNAVGGFIENQPSYTTQKPCPKYSQGITPHELGIPDMSVDTCYAPQKRFLIFDQSGSHTRLFFSPSFSLQNQIGISKTPKLDQQFFTRHLVEENWGENHLTDGEDEMNEDSEDIDALFFSDTDDSQSKDCDTEGDDNEVTSMARVLLSNEHACSNELSLEELTEEVASSNGTQKRRKLLDGRYILPSSLLNNKGPVERASSCTYENDLESSCAGCQKSCDDINSIKREKRVKVRDVLKSLEAIIPGLNSSDPLHVIEKAIDFLKSMRIEAEALGLGYLDHQFAASP
ncbi:transcription factor SAC51-like [Andrographis paniculata]|uniref:transcription factor SAC51-like n=1 Tax=Andrographis paniculata TaxID=175694 RepID=UPI0021E7DCA8|nr:transcription factor SAC51-like [Andrographis paniculata]